MKNIVVFLLLLCNVSFGQVNKMNLGKNLVTCTNWLKTLAPGQNVKIGDLDIPGNQLTIEAQFDRIPPITAIYYLEEIVSKHSDPSNVNYFLRIDHAEITTTNGYFVTPSICNIQLDKTYHTAMVYDGNTLKFYRNGFLMSQVPCTGNMIQNNYSTTIGEYAYPNPMGDNFYGYLNEVRIWNVARTQTQIRTFMNSSLPSPTTQPGLLAYYTFDDLLNKQGNPAWNGTLNGGATINNTNPNCNFVADSCPVSTPISNIINDYTPVLALGTCDNKITVEDGTKFNTGDTVLMIQMKGAVVDSTNTAAFGTITDYKNAGNYEFNYVKSKAGNIIELKNKLTRQYDIPQGKVQLVRVPYYNSALITSTLTCLPWDGSKGGILVLNVRDTITLNANIDVSGRGFLGGNDPVTNPPVFYCYENQYYYPVNPDLASEKGEGIAVISAAKSYGKGALANGGGSGNSHNSGGAGGGNIGAGGFGGYQFEGSPCDGTIPFDNRGISGRSLTYSTASNKIFLGGGGGAGQSNNFEGFQAKGGNGAGIIMILTDKIINNSNKIIADGNPGLACGLSNTGCHEGMGGGGAAGTVLLQINSYLDNTNVETKGGDGANMVSSGNLRVGPGGGGSGGAVWLTNAALPANVSVTNTGGTNGVCVTYGNDPWGSTSGQTGQNIFNLSIPVDNVLFRPNIDSVRIKDSLTSCFHYDFKGLAYTNTSPINNWQWYFGDGGTAVTQNASHIYAGPGIYTVKLIVTDMNGCKDSVSKNLNVQPCSGIGNIINDYTPVLAFNPCDNKLTVEDASAFNPGDTVLVIQMKGAVIDSSNTVAFGTITNYNNSGNYEFNYVKTKAGNIIELKNILNRQYDIPNGKVQLIRVPYYNSVVVSATLTCLPWDGNKGGVLVLNAKDTVELNADINTTGKGFLKGTMHNSNVNAYTCDVTDYYFQDNTIDAAGKGEGISFLSSNRNSGKGPAANGGGGGMNTNSGGGGGSNGNTGGRGGYEWNGGCPNYLTISNWGYPGKLLTYNTVSNKIFMGGAGGAGHCNNQFDDPTFNADYNGGNGGGLIIVNADYIKGNSKQIISKGDSAYQPVFSPTYVVHDGMGGGGAGGTVLINGNTYINNLLVDVSGGKGADLVSNVAGPGYVGPGGGGGGGVVWVKQNALPANLNVTNAGGLNGVIEQAGNIPYGAAPGSAGINVFSLTVPFDNVAFKKNIDSVRIKDSLTACSVFDFKGLGYINFNPINTWQWYFGDGGTANTQNTSHVYGSSGIFTVKLIATDINGCKDSVMKDVNTNGFTADAGADTAICSNGTVSVTLHGSPGATTYAWTPAIYLNNPSAQNPVATISSTTRFYLNATSSFGCGATDSVTITINPVPVVKTLIDTATCKGSGLILTTSGVASTWHWSPGLFVSDSTISNPVYTEPVGHTLYVTGTNVYGCAGKDTINVTVKPLPVVRTIADTIICSTNTLTLFTNGAQTYSWSPVNNLSDPNIANPVFSGNAGQTYYVTGTAANGCKGKDTVNITVNVPGTLKQPPGKSMCALTSVQLNGFNGNSVSYLWSPGIYLSNTTVINPIAFPPVTTPFQVIVTDKACNYDSTFIVRVIVDPIPNINAGKSNDIDCAAKFATLHASGGVKYLWTPSTGLNRDTIANPIATPVSTQQYVVSVTNAAGCSNKDSVTVYNNFQASLARYMPNAFTPDGNGHNDCYGLLRWLHVNQLWFAIYNRFGEMVFASGDPNACWDGNYKGKPALAGTYVYYIKAHTSCGMEEQKGAFLLIR